MLNLLATNNWLNWVIIVVLIVAIVAMFALSGRKNKQREKEYVEQLAAIKPGNKVKTAGGICGIVVEVCDDDNTVIIETGSELSGKSYIKMDKTLIAQTDAKGPTQIAREEAEARRQAAKQAEKSSAEPEEVATPATEESASPADAADETVSEEKKD